MTPDASIELARRILSEACGERIKEDYPIAPMTSFRIGGPAALFLEPQSGPDLAVVSRAVAETGIPMTIIGKGSNILVSDAGFRGLVLRLGKGFRWAARDGLVLTAGAAMPLPALAGVALSHGLSGLEFGIAIPGSLGGAVRMNAGAHGEQMEDVVREVEVFSVGSGYRTSLAASVLGFSYRRASLPEGSVVVAVTLELSPEAPAEIRRRMREARGWRRATQPLAEPNCGSVFKNPEGDHAARLVDAAGAKGLSVGGATVSKKHANFIVTSPGATAWDVVGLIDRVRDVVRSRFGIDLEREVQLVGDFGPTEV